MSKSSPPVNVVESAHFVATNAQHVKINNNEIMKFISNNSLMAEIISNFSKPLLVPLNFETINDEITFWCMVDLLNFGSGFRHLLHTHCQKGAYKVIFSGVISMFIGRNMSTHAMRTINQAEISEYFRIPLIIEETKINDVMSVPKLGGPLKPLIDHIQKALNETGEILFSYGYDDFSSFILDKVKTETPSAMDLVQKLVSLFPAFRDTALYKGRTVYIYKKAQLLTCDLFRVLRKKDKRFDFPDLSRLTVFTDNVVPCVLRKYGILTLSEHLANIIDSKQVLPRGDLEVELRLCAVHACRLIVTEVQNRGLSQFCDAHLDYYLWETGKRQDFVNLERHSTQDTCYY